MAIFGYNTIGGTPESPSQNIIWGSLYTCPTNGTAQSIAMYFSGNIVDYIQFAIYDNVGPNLLAKTNSLVESVAPGWYTIPLLTTPTLVAGNSYWLCFNSQYGYAVPYYDAGGTQEYVAQTFGTWPSSIVLGNTQSRQISIYCNYNLTSSALGITTNAATNVLYTTVQLNGYVNIGDASSATVTFDYGLTNAYGTTVTATQSPVAASQAVSANVAALSASTLYHFRAKAIG